MSKLTKAQLIAENIALREAMQALEARLAIAEANAKPVRLAPTPFYVAFDLAHARSACVSAAKKLGRSVRLMPTNTPRGVAYALC